jgi:hypothetical protein
MDHATADHAMYFDETADMRLAADIFFYHKSCLCLEFYALLIIGKVPEKPACRPSGRLITLKELQVQSHQPAKLPCCYAIPFPIPIYSSKRNVNRKKLLIFFLFPEHTTARL